MSLRDITKTEIIKHLKAVGIKENDHLLIHSALHLLGRPEGGIGIYLDALLEIISEDGTIAVPTFCWDFARGKKYDPSSTPSQNMGVFSEYVRTQKNAKRSTHPLQSLSVIGKHQDRLVSIDTVDVFVPGSVFESMLGLDFKLLLLGAEIQASSMVHYSEQRPPVPYRFWKTFDGDYKAGENWEKRAYKMFVRDLDVDAKLVLKPIQTRLEERGQWSSVKVNYGYIAAFTLEEFKQATDDLLAGDKWALIGNREEALTRFNEKIAGSK